MEHCRIFTNVHTLSMHIEYYPQFIIVSYNYKTITVDMTERHTHTHMQI